MSTDSREMLTAHELVEKRIIVEANRVFFHPLGLHLTFDDGELIIARGETTIHYGGFTDQDRIAIQRLHAELMKNNMHRAQQVGFQIQPIQSKESQTIARLIYKKEVTLKQVTDDIERIKSEMRRPFNSDDPRYKKAHEQDIARKSKVLGELRKKERDLLQTIEVLREKGEHGYSA